MQSHLDAILLSHTHADHVGVAARAQLPKNLALVVAAAGAEATCAAGFTDVRPLDSGETLNIEARGTTLDVRAVPAHHCGDSELDRALGRGNGYVLASRDARGIYRVYRTGDAVLSDETKDLTDRVGRIDLLLPHMVVWAETDRAGFVRWTPIRRSEQTALQHADMLALWRFAEG